MQAGVFNAFDRLSKQDNAFGDADVCSDLVSEALITPKFPHRCFPIGSYSNVIWLLSDALTVK